MPIRRAGAECLGTFVLVFGGVGTAVIAGEQGRQPRRRVRLRPVAAGDGLRDRPGVGLPHQPGRHARAARGPADRRRRGRRATGSRRSSAAIVAAGLLLAIVSARKAGYDAGVEGLGANGYGAHSPDGYPWGAAFAAEVVLTAFLVFTVLSATDRIATVAFAGIPIGLVLTLIHLVGIPITNTSVNPARSIGPALFVGGWAIEQLWLFIVAPLRRRAARRGRPPVPVRGRKPIEPEESAVAAV